MLSVTFSALSRSLVQGSPTECGVCLSVIVKLQEALIHWGAVESFGELGGSVLFSDCCVTRLANLLND